MPKAQQTCTGLMPASSDTVESEWRKRKQYTKVNKKSMFSNARGGRRVTLLYYLEIEIIWAFMRVELFNKKTSPKYRADVRFWDSLERIMGERGGCRLQRGELERGVGGAQ
jgi:hypothetical protein